MMINKCFTVIIFSLFVKCNTECWWSGCQPNTWAQQGCYPDQKWQEVNRLTCYNGLKFKCCRRRTSSSSIYIPSVPNTLYKPFIRNKSKQSFAPEQDKRCWWSGCQPNTWAQQGCFPDNDWKEVTRTSCTNGLKFKCCAKNSNVHFPSSTSTSTSESKGAEQGICSWYGAPGEISPNYVLPSYEKFNALAMRTAHRTLPFFTKIRVTNLENGKEIDVMVNDRGPFISERILDLTRGAFQKVEHLGRGLFRCSYKFI